MKNNEKNIEFIGMKPRRSVTRYIELQVEKWIEREQSLMFLPKNASYKVIIEKDTESNCYHCALEIRIGIREWKSVESGRTLPESLAQAQKHLKPFAKNPAHYFESFVA